MPKKNTIYIYNKIIYRIIVGVIQNSHCYHLMINLKKFNKINFLYILKIFNKIIIKKTIYNNRNNNFNINSKNNNNNYFNINNNNNSNNNNKSNHYNINSNNLNNNNNNNSNN